MKYLHTMIRISDIDKSLDFFCTKLGLREVERYTSESGRYTLIYLAAPADLVSAETDRRPSYTPRRVDENPPSTNALPVRA